MNDAAFLAELRDAARINELEDQRAEMRDAVREASQEAELYDGQPVMHLPNDLYMVFDDPDYSGSCLGSCFSVFVFGAYYAR